MTYDEARAMLAELAHGAMVADDVFAQWIESPHVIEQLAGEESRDLLVKRTGQAIAGVYI